MNRFVRAHDFIGDPEQFFKTSCLGRMTLGFAFLLLGITAALAAPALEASGASSECAEPIHFLCTVDKKTVTFDFQSPTHDCTNDDMQVTANGQKLDMPLQWYLPSYDVTLKSLSVCPFVPDKQGYKGYTGYPVGPHQIALFNRVSNRPGRDQIFVSLFDVATLTLVDNKLLGTTANEFLGIVPTSRGYRLPLIDNRSEGNFACDCDAGEVNAWVDVTFEGQKIHSHWISLSGK